MKMSIKDLDSVRMAYHSLYKTKTYHQEFRFYAVHFSERLPVVSCGAVWPEYDFSGKNIQEILSSSDPIEPVAFNLTSFGGNSVVMFGWTDKDGPAEKLVDSFKQLPDDEKANAAVSFAFEYIENTLVKPSWWNGMAEAVQRAALHHLTAGLPSREYAHDIIVSSSNRPSFVSSPVKAIFGVL